MPGSAMPGSSDWPTLPDAALHGLAGDAVRTLDPYTEADPAAVLLQFLAAFGNTVGPGPHFVVESTRHTSNLFVALVGETAKARKGTAWALVAALMKAAAPDWFKNCCVAGGGLVSGEGLIYHVRDPGHIITKGKQLQPDPGVTDKRLLVVEQEFARVLRVGSREGNSLTAVMRSAWDDGHLRSLAKKEPVTATGAHVSIVGHIVAEELRKYLNNTEIAGGLGNRFLWASVRRSKCLPDGGKPPPDQLSDLVRRIDAALQAAKGIGQVERDEFARALWHTVYSRLSEGRPGLHGALAARAEAQVMRLSLVYALLDCSPVVRECHLQAALSLWEYCDDSVRYLFGDEVGDPVADKILSALRTTIPHRVTRTEINKSLQGHSSASRIDSALRALMQAGLVVRAHQRLTSGRPAEEYCLADEAEEAEEGHQSHPAAHDPVRKNAEEVLAAGGSPTLSPRSSACSQEAESHVQGLFPHGSLLPQPTRCTICGVAVHDYCLVGNRRYCPECYDRMMDTAPHCSFQTCQPVSPTNGGS